jgi:hypothetical protein
MGLKKVEELAMGSQPKRTIYLSLRKSDDYTVQVQDAKPIMHY